eukprot:NODE_88_length_21789_cov_0.534440.p16 type:complete len:130 gc:universal NODE_88_length_21789_cov_0.534440:14083-13694(-)
MSCGSLITFEKTLALLPILIFCKAKITSVDECPITNPQIVINGSLKMFLISGTSKKSTIKCNLPLLLESFTFSRTTEITLAESSNTFKDIKLTSILKSNGSESPISKSTTKLLLRVTASDFRLITVRFK